MTLHCPLIWHFEVCREGHMKKQKSSQPWKTLNNQALTTVADVINETNNYRLVLQLNALSHADYCSIICAAFCSAQRSF